MMLTSDLSKSALKWLKGVLGGTLFSTTLGGAPVPASRPRVSKWGTYYGKRYTAWKKAAETEAATHPQKDTSGRRVIMVESVIAKPKTVDRDVPMGDVDNYAKAPMDALNKAAKVWKDDEQVVMLVAVKRFVAEGETPTTNINIWRVD